VPAPPLGRPAGALVIGGDYRGLGVVRSLGRQGIPVWVLTDEHRIAATSRYARRSLPWPAADQQQQRDYLLELAEQHHLEGWMLFPTGDETAALIARHHAVLAERFRLTTPSWDVIRWAYDKRLTHQLAMDADVAHPWTYYPADRTAVSALDCAFPAILKPAIKNGANAFTDAKAWRVTDRATLLAGYDEACTLVAPDVIMIQELIPGGGEQQFSFAALCWEGAPLAWIGARRTRQFPMDFGRSSSYVETNTQPEVEQSARRLIAQLKYTGLIEVEFKRDPRDGSYKLLDINPRVWGWHTLGQRAGVNFPYLLWRLMASESIPQVQAAHPVRWVRMSTDLPTVAREIRRGNISLAAYLQSLRGPLEFAIFAPDDPFPALAELPILSLLAWERRAAARRPKPLQNVPAALRNNQ
jgi:predicted ATP-grasp superfamily ATP-dependent carboligase